MTKYIFITGGVVSSLGKGITAASLGRLLKSRGYHVINQKFDPYLNVDPGKMSPYQHGEVFVTDDGAETDLDLGHYERFTDTALNVNNSVTTGKIYSAVINRERNGEYDGGTVQVIPHVTNEIKERIMRAGKDKDVDIVITEIGGTVGDIESLPFLEAIRQLKYDIGQENVLYLHVTLVPYLHRAGEQKSKPTQHSVKDLRSIGIQPDILICRTEMPLEPGLAEKIALFCNLAPNEVFENLDASSIYEIPRMLEEQGLPQMVLKKLGLPVTELHMEEWDAMLEAEERPEGEVRIALVGKYVELKDAYISVAESVRHGGIANRVKATIDWIHAEELTLENVDEQLGQADGILIPPGFGDRGMEGKILAAQYGREHRIPTLGIHMGMQVMLLDVAINLLGYADANSVEFDKNGEHLIIDRLPEQADLAEVPMRLGAHPCRLKEGTLAHEIYGEPLVYERHRNRYEINSSYRSELESQGVVISGTSPDGRLIEVVEREDHPWYVGVLYHPEYQSRPTRCHPLFKAFAGAAVKHQREQDA